MNRKWRLAIIAAIIVVIAATASFYFAWGRTNGGSIKRGPVWDAVERTLGPFGSSNPVKEDLIKRGLVSLGEQGHIDVQEIERLVNEGVYTINEQGYLEFGPTYSPP